MTGHEQRGTEQSAATPSKSFRSNSYRFSVRKSFRRNSYLPFPGGGRVQTGRISDGRGRPAQRVCPPLQTGIQTGRSRSALPVSGSSTLPASGSSRWGLPAPDRHGGAVRHPAIPGFFEIIRQISGPDDSGGQKSWSAPTKRTAGFPRPLRFLPWRLSPRPPLARSGLNPLEKQHIHLARYGIWRAPSTTPARDGCTFQFW